MDITKEIENASRLAYLEAKGKDVNGDLASNRSRLQKMSINADDLTQAIVYLTNVYAHMLQRNSTADGARFELLCRALAKENMLSEGTISTLADDLNKITEQENKGE